MFRFVFTLFTVIYLSNFASSQFNGEFWWLHDKVTTIHGTAAPPVQFEALSGFETDEGDKVLYRSAEVENKQKVSSGIEKTSRTVNIPIVTLHFPDWDRFLWSLTSKYYQNNSQHSVSSDLTKNTTSANRGEDEFLLKFPVDDNFIWKNESHTIFDGSTTEPQLQDIVLPTNTNTSPKLELEDKLTFNDHKQKDNKTENICTYMVEFDCRRNNGSVYPSIRSQTKLEICCILPLEAERRSGQIIFLDNVKPNLKRHLRSLDERKKILNQRTAIQQQANKRIVTPDEDDDDPYDNIRNYQLRRPNSNVFNYPTRPQYEDSIVDEEYADELPKPGLIGLYSDSGKKPWPFLPGANLGESVLIGDEVGYRLPILDPRLDDRISVVTRPPRRKPSKSTSAAQITNDKDVERITYQSKPDFRVMQGFKLLNLMRNRSKMYKKRSKLIGPSGTGYQSIATSLKNQVFDDCGAVEDVSEEYNYDDSQEDVRLGSVPWLALVFSKRQQRGLCYAILVHPRAAVTSASCVYEYPGDVVVYAGGGGGGAWEPAADSSRAQRRSAQVLLHPLYAEDDFNDMAILHWSRPLQMNGTVKVVCLDDPQAGESCLYIGSGDGAGLRRQPQQQRATVLASRECLPQRNRGFCAAIDGHFVAGAAVFCRRGGRWAAVGLAAAPAAADARRDSPRPLLPLRPWTRDALTTLGIP